MTTTINKHVNPICKTTWAQAGGFNSKSPDYDNNEPQKWPLGCTTIATAQIMMTHKYPSYIQWSSFPLYNYNTPLCEFLYNLAKTVIKVDLKVDEGKADIGKVVDAFKYYGYNTIEINHFENGHTNSSVTENLDRGYPVFMSGTDSDSGHAWICDGYESSATSWVWELWCLEDCPESYNPQSFYQISTYNPNTSFGTFHLHMNWGWRGYLDGYFSEFNISTPEGNFANNRKDIVDIYPRN